ncbi:metal-dependent hydrolase [Candidatus Woesearchaeota archaeon]|nr:metal-dependent hydrolase [Candidatus Woesearchaeota archaeon]
MYPQSHFLLPFFLAELLVQFGWLTHTNAIIAGLVGMFVDIDHFIEFFFHHKVLSIRRSWNNAVQSHEKCPRTFVHRTNGLLVITALMAGLFFINKSNIALALGLGYYTHILLDSFDAYNIGHIFKLKAGGFIMNISLFEIIFDLLFLISSVVLSLY